MQNNEVLVKFVYNPFGQRVIKKEIPRAGGSYAHPDGQKITYYTYDANGQVMAIYEITNGTSIQKATLKEQNIYGASRIGQIQTDLVLFDQLEYLTQLEPSTHGLVKNNVVGKRRYEITNYLGNVNAVITDRRSYNSNPVTSSLYEAVVVNTADYYPFGMVMPERHFSNENYRYAYNGMEVDPEMKGDGNSYTTEFRQYDPRIGRWKSCDPKRHWFPDMSAYCFASNSPIAGKDDNGLYTIFVNGYTGDGKPGNWNEATPGYQYWRGSKDNPSEFINAAHNYFGDGYHKFVDGSGDFITSTAGTRQAWGRKLGVKLAEEIIKEIKELNSDSDPTNDVKEINIVSHSMGAAVSEGIIETLMKDEELKKYLEKGEIVHFSACDGDNIEISENSKHLKRSQLNYKFDLTLMKADPGGASTGGYKIPGIKRFGVVNSNYLNWNKKSNYDFHYRSKTFKEAWDFLKILDLKLNSGSKGTIILEKSELNIINNWDHRDGTTGPTIPNNAA